MKGGLQKAEAEGGISYVYTLIAPQKKVKSLSRQSETGKHSKEENSRKNEVDRRILDVSGTNTRDD